MAMKMSSKFGKMDASKNSYQKAMPKPSKAMGGYGDAQKPKGLDQMKSMKMRQARMEAMRKRSQTMGSR